MQVKLMQKPSNIVLIECKSPLREWPKRRAATLKTALYCRNVGRMRDYVQY